MSRERDRAHVGVRFIIARAFYYGARTQCSSSNVPALPASPRRVDSRVYVYTSVRFYESRNFVRQPAVDAKRLLRIAGSRFYRDKF